MTDGIVALGLLLSTTSFWLAARWYVVPAVQGLPLRDVLPPILLLHSFRHVGLMFLAPGAVKTALPDAFAYPAAWGDLLAAALAFAALAAVRLRVRGHVALVWIFNTVGTLDLVYAVAQGVRLGAAGGMGATIWIPMVVVPLLLVTHALVFVLLLRGTPQERLA